MTMPQTSNQTSTGVRLMDTTFHFEDGSYWAESSDVPRWIAVANTWEELQQLVNEFALLQGYDGWFGIAP